ncbi:MAG TPA: AAA family ATPase [Candidatus Eisenbacteria bacterium]|nr:AAA family ATPase [Candidatus Eisenbacteria bacterium]
MELNHRFILTGAPGGGKTAILARLGPGIRPVAEPAREVLAEERAAGGRGTPDQDAGRFVELLLARSIEKYEAAGSGEPVLYDRGIPDCVGYAVHLGADPSPGVEAAVRYRYHPQVLVLEPWEAIYTTDDERKMTYAQAVGFHEELLEGYRNAGYELITVPREPIEQRIAFIREFIARATLREPRTAD